MTSRDPDLTADIELRNTMNELQGYEAIAVATNDAYGTLEAILGASDADTARRALQQLYDFTELQAVADGHAVPASDCHRQGEDRAATPGTRSAS